MVESDYSIVGTLSYMSYQMKLYVDNTVNNESLFD